MSIDDRLQELGIQLPPPPGPVGLYKPAVRSGNMLYVSGQLPVADGEFTAIGRLGRRSTWRRGGPRRGSARSTVWPRRPARWARSTRSVRSSG